MKPSEYVRRQVRVTPFPGEDVAELISISSPEIFLFSSDYPHPEGTKDPIGRFDRSFDEHGVDDGARQLFYEDNYGSLLRLCTPSPPNARGRRLGRACQA